MSVDWEFRNKAKPWLRDGTPTTAQLKKIFLSGKIPGVKVMGLHKDDPFSKIGFRVDCGGDCWLHVHDKGGKPFVKMAHFDHVVRADSVLQMAADIAGCTVLNDLTDNETDAWAGKPPAKSGKVVNRVKIVKKCGCK